MKFRQVDLTFTEPDLTPMIDLVFLLLTFFVVAVNFENTRADERLRLPVDAFAKPPDSRLDHELRLTFGYDGKPDGAPHGQAVVFVNGVKISIDRIKPALEQEAKFFQAKALKNPKQALEHVSVVIQADAGLSTGLVQELIETCQAAGFTKFSLQAMPFQD